MYYDFMHYDLMVTFIREWNPFQSVIDVLVIDVFNLGYDAQGDHWTRLYCCDPCTSFQKSNVDLNHEFISVIFYSRIASSLSLM